MQKKAKEQNSPAEIFSKQNGYTLIEVVISLFIVSVVILIYAVSSRTLVLNRDAKYRQLANRIAASEMEDLRNLPFDNLPASGPFTYQLLDSLPNAQAVIDISDVNANLKHVTVSISWKAPGTQQAHQASLTTLIGKHGL